MASTEFLPGIDFGDKFSPRRPVQDELLKRGVRMHRVNITAIRNGRKNGRKTADRIAANQTLASGSASRKNELYLEVTDALVAVRLTQGGLNPHLYRSIGHMEEAAARLKLNPQLLRRLIRVMRADVLYPIDRSYKENVTNSLIACATEFLEGYIRRVGGHKEDGKSIRSLREEWNGYSIGDFYKKMYLRLGVRAIGAWGPYEATFLKTFYQIERQVNGDKLTDFDVLALGGYVARRTESVLAAFVAKNTSVPLDTQTMTQHRYALCYGLPYNPNLMR